MTVDEVMAELEKLGSEQQRKTYARHGATAPMFGVKIGDMKPMLKRIKTDQALVMDLYDTGNLDAMYLAGMAANGATMSREKLDSWARSASWHLIASSSVAPVAVESPLARELALAWIESPEELVASAGWHTYSGIIAVYPDDTLDLSEIDGLLCRIEKTVHGSQNRVRSAMMCFVSSVGGYVSPMLGRAKESARLIGPVHIDVGDTACKPVSPLDMINKIESMGRVGKKRKTMKC